MGTSHKQSKSDEYRAWLSMKTRCLNPNAANYHRYGGRGIGICAQWTHSFETFLADVGMRPSKDHSLDRIDTNGDYTPQNCRWATFYQQATNKRTTRLSLYRVTEIKQMKSQGARVEDMATMYNVTISAIYKALQGVHWSRT